MHASHIVLLTEPGVIPDVEEERIERRIAHVERQFRIAPEDVVLCQAFLYGSHHRTVPGRIRHREAPRPFAD